jgi:hypothetical protein
VTTTTKARYTAATTVGSCERDADLWAAQLDDPFLPPPLGGLRAPLPNP